MICLDGTILDPDSDFMTVDQYFGRSWQLPQTERIFSVKTIIDRIENETQSGLPFEPTYNIIFPDEATKLHAEQVSNLIFKRTDTRAQTHARTHARTHTHANTNTHTHARTHTHTHTRAHTHTTHALTHAHTYTRTLTHTHTHTHTRTHTLSLRHRHTHATTHT